MDLRWRGCGGGRGKRLLDLSRVVQPSLHGRGTGALGVHAAPKSHGQARALGHQPRGLLVATGLREREAGIHSDPPGGSSGSARLSGERQDTPGGINERKVLEYSGHVAEELRPIGPLNVGRR